MLLVIGFSLALPADNTSKQDTGSKGFMVNTHLCRHQDGICVTLTYGCGGVRVALKQAQGSVKKRRTKNEGSRKKKKGQQGNS